MTRISVTDYFNTTISELNKGLERLCTETDSHFLGSLLKEVEDPDRPMTLTPSITRDGAHFNFDGYEILGKAIVKELEGIGTGMGIGMERGAGAGIEGEAGTAMERGAGMEAGVGTRTETGIGAGTWFRGKRVLLVGDSITAGYPEYEPLLLGKGYGDEQHSFGYYIRTMLECDVVNCGISGDLTSSMVSRLSVHLQEEPDLVILQGGANDAYYSVEMRAGMVTREMALDIVREILGNFRSMVEECKEAGVQRAVMPLLPFYGEFIAGE